VGFQNTSGMLRILKLPAYYVPSSRVRLLSTTSLLQKYTKETIQVESNIIILSGIQGDPARGSVMAYVDPSNNLPSTVAYRYNDTEKGSKALSAAIATVDKENIILSESEKELLRWHQRLGHLGMRKIQFFMRSGVLAHSEKQRHLHTVACKVINPPKCAACQFGKQRRRPAPGKASAAVNHTGALTKDDLIPGQKVSVDHFVC
jgi:hypothetical protein